MFTLVPEEVHFCLTFLSGAYENIEKREERNQQMCLAKVISEQHKTRCLVQVTYVNFAGDVGVFINIFVAISSQGKVASTNSSLDSVSYIYRPERMVNSVLLNTNSCILWGYTLITERTHAKTLDRVKVYKERMIQQKNVMNPIYPIYEEIKKLAPKNQILPCQVYNKGKLEDRIVEVDVFNQNDLEYS